MLPLLLFARSSHRPSPIRPFRDSRPVDPEAPTGISLRTLPNDVCADTRIDRTRKIPVTVLLRALGYESDEKILKLYDGDAAIEATLTKDPVKERKGPKAVEEALIEIYRRLRPGDPPTVESARQLLQTLFFDPRRYDLGKVGRHKLNRKLGLEAPLPFRTLVQTTGGEVKDVSVRRLRDLAEPRADVGGAADVGQRH